MLSPLAGRGRVWGLQTNAMLTLACCFLLPFYRRGQPLLCHPKHTDSLSQSTLSMCSNFEPIIQKKYPVSYSFECTMMLKCVRFYGRAIDYKNIIYHNYSPFYHKLSYTMHTACFLSPFYAVNSRFVIMSSGSITSAVAAAAVLQETSDCNQGLVGMYKSSIEEDPKPLTPQSPCYNQVSITLYFLIHFTWTATNDVFTCHKYYKPYNYLLYF